MLKRLLRRPETQAAMAAILGRYLVFALRSTSWTIIGEEFGRPHFAGRPAIVAVWHEFLPLMPAMWEVARRAGSSGAHVLVSRHTDGQLIGAVLSRFGLGFVHGSTGRGTEDRGGAAAVRRMVAVLARGDHVVATPDGPRGPRRVAAAGIAQVAALSGVPVLPCAAQTDRRRILRTWDRMVLPLPWARGVLVCRPAIEVPRRGWEAAMPAICRALTEAADQAEQACP